MKSILFLAMLSLLASMPVRAYEVETGSVLICDTQEQAERFVQLFDGNPQHAINSVNMEEHNPNACAVVEAAYVVGPQLGVVRNSSHAFEIAPIVVVGMATPRGYRQVDPTLFFSIVSLREFAV